MLTFANAVLQERSFKMLAKLFTSPLALLRIFIFFVLINKIQRYLCSEQLEKQRVAYRFV